MSDRYPLSLNTDLAGDETSPRCTVIARCGRPSGHRGHHGGFRQPEATPADLTSRQREAVSLLVEGWSDAEIGARMVPPISENTVGNHLEDAARRAGHRDLNRVLLAVWFTRRVSEAAWARLV